MRYRRHIRRLIALLALPALLAVLLTFPTGWGCRLAERIVRRLDLVQAVPGLTFNFQHLSPTRVEIGGVALGTEAGAPALERLTVRFTPRGLRRHTIGEIECRNPRARLIVGSNRVTLAGMELLEDVLHRPPTSTTNAVPWQIGAATVSDFRVQLVPERDDHGWPDEVAGTLRIRNAGDGTCELALRGAALDIPFWGTGEARLDSRGGELSVTFPQVPFAVVREAMARFVPHVPQPPLDGVCHLSLQTGFTNAAPESATVLALTRGPLHIEAGDISLTLATLVAAAHWQPGPHPWGDFKNITLEGRLAGLHGLPTAIAAGLDQAQFHIGHIPAAPGEADALRFRGHLTLPALAPLADGAESRIGFSLTAATNRLALAVQAPPLAGAAGAGDAAIAWRVGSAEVTAEAHQAVETGKWRLSGAAGISGASVTHALAHVSNLTVRVPFLVGCRQRRQGPHACGPHRQPAADQPPTLSRALSVTLSKTEEEEEAEEGAANGRESPFILGTPEIAWGVARLLDVELTSPVVLPRDDARPGYLPDETCVFGPTGSVIELAVHAAVSQAGGIEAALRCAPAKLTPRDPLVAAGLARVALPPAVHDTLDFAGRVSLDGRVVLEPGREPFWHATVGLDAGRVAVSGKVPAVIDGLRTGLRVEGVGPHVRLAPLVTSFTNAALAGLEVPGGTLRWRLAQKELLVEEAEFDWCGGKARLYAVRLDLTHPDDLDLVLYIDRMDAGELIRLIKPLDGTATGHLYGRLPLRIRQGQVRLSEGFLYSLPGERGNLKLHNTRFLQDYLAKIGLPSGTRKNLVDALADLDYHIFRADLSTSVEREAKLVLKLAGRAAANRELPPVDLDIRVNGPLEALLNLGLQVNKTAP